MQQVKNPQTTQQSCFPGGGAFFTDEPPKYAPNTYALQIQLMLLERARCDHKQMKVRKTNTALLTFFSLSSFSANLGNGGIKFSSAAIFKVCQKEKFLPLVHLFRNAFQTN